MQVGSHPDAAAHQQRHGAESWRLVRLGPAAVNKSGACTLLQLQPKLAAVGQQPAGHGHGRASCLPVQACPVVKSSWAHHAGLIQSTSLQ